MIGTVGAIALGGAIGALSRFGVNIGVEKLLGAAFPWGTLIINIAGCFLMGVLMARSAQMDALSPELRTFCATGFLGAFTTFSTFSLDFVTMWERGEMMQAALYMIASVVLSVLGLCAGLMIMRGFAS